LADIFKPLFNRNLLRSRMKRFEFELSSQQKKLIEDWAKTVADPLFRREKEKPLQGQFLEHIFGTVLDYTHAVGHLDAYHLKVETASSKTKGGKTPDGILGYYGKDKDITRAVIELKAPNVDLDLKQKGREGGLTPVEQGFGYASKFEGVKWVIISNFHTVRLYSTASGQAYCHEFNMANLSEEHTLHSFIFLLHKDRLISEKAEVSYTEQIASESYTQEKKITKEFYSFYRDVRLRLFHQLVRENPCLESASHVDHEIELLAKAQKILDRVLFICFCEDTGLLPHGVIRKAIDAADIRSGFVRSTRWQQMLGLFRSIDKGDPPLGINGYNGGLFAFDADLEALAVADQITDDFRLLAEYDFDTDLNVNVLGHVFEQSIADLEALRAEVRSEKVDKQNAKRKREGVYYTPEYITRFIVENTVGTWLKEQFDALESQIKPDNVRGGKKRREAYVKLWSTYQDVLRNIKVLDPACGSGAFLVAAFDYLHSEYTKTNRELTALEFGQTRLFDLDRQILQNNIFGVDINPESVEITKLSLWLKTANRLKPLNNLDSNIKCGNSLLDPQLDRWNKANYPKDLMKRAFDWGQEFPQVFAQGGFDCVFGNPPYIRSSLLTDYKAFLQKEYRSFNSGADIYIYFFERGLRLTKNGGRLGYITSGSYVRTAFAKEFRKWLPTEASFEKIVNFGENQPFEDAEMIYPTISILRKDSNGGSFSSLFMYGGIPASIESAMESESVICDHSACFRNEWVFQSSAVSSIFDRLLGTGKPLSAVSQYRSYRGVTTGLNEAFIVNDETRERLIKEDAASADIVRPILGGEDLRPWYCENRKCYIIFTRHGIDIDQYPAIRSYLEQYRERLEPKPLNWPKGKTWPGRKEGSYSWYEIQDSTDYYRSFDKPKIIWPDISKLPRFSFDSSGFYINATGSFFEVESPWILPLLQSRLLWFCISQIASPLRLRGGLWQYRCKQQYIDRLPIPDVRADVRTTLAGFAMQATSISNERYKLHESVRHRIRSDFGGGNGKLNQMLTSWWEIDFPGFRTQVRKVFKTDIPLKERAEWEQALAKWREDHNQLTQKLVDIETESNEVVYRLYGLSKADIQFLEDHMKKTMIHYPFGSI